MHDNHFYQPGTVAALLLTDNITDFTKKILQQRLDKKDALPAFFSTYHFHILTVVCDVLMAQDATKRICSPAIAIDERLANNKADGWRYDAMPPDKIAYKNGLAGIDEFALMLYKIPFTELTKDKQTGILQQLQQGTITGNIWKELPSTIFFEELLAEVTAIFYSHPLVQEEIGFVGMADTHGWQNIGINEKNTIEPDEIKPTQ